MSTVTYPEPVNKLLTFGEPDLVLPESWPNYIEAVGLGPEHIPDLIRMAEDRELRIFEGEDEEDEEDESYITSAAPIHALRALGQLKAQAAIQPLVDLLPTLQDEGSEWMLEETPRVLGMIGPAAISALAIYLADSSHETYSRAYASNGLVEIAQKFPEHRAECIAAICKPLEVPAAENDEVLNGFLIDDLIELKALEAVPVMEQAFAQKRVDLSIAGDWDEVQVALGLKERSEVPVRRWNGLEDALDLNPALPGSLTAGSGLEPRKHHSNKKAKEKMAKQSRKKNRRKKR